MVRITLYSLEPSWHHIQIYTNNGYTILLSAESAFSKAQQNGVCRYSTRNIEESNTATLYFIIKSDIFLYFLKVHKQLTGYERIIYNIWKWESLKVLQVLKVLQYSFRCSLLSQK